MLWRNVRCWALCELCMWGREHWPIFASVIWSQNLVGLGGTNKFWRNSGRLRGYPICVVQRPLPWLTWSTSSSTITRGRMVIMSAWGIATAWVSGIPSSMGIATPWICRWKTTFWARDSTGSTWMARSASWHKLVSLVLGNNVFWNKTCFASAPLGPDFAADLVLDLNDYDLCGGTRRQPQFLFMRTFYPTLQPGIAFVRDLGQLQRV